MFFKLSRLWLIPLLICLCFIEAQGSGYVRISNYTKEKYGGGAQNWCVIQDEIGKIYVGNRDGMLIFDGERWKRAYLANYTTVRSLMYDGSDGRIYAGGSEELGYFTNDANTGVLSYKSLMDSFQEDKPSFSEIWNIYKIDGAVWFQADNYLFCLSDNRLKTYPVGRRISASSQVGKSIYLALDDGRIIRLSNGMFYEFRDISAISGKKVAAILPFGQDGEIMIATSLDGLYRSVGDRIVPFDNRFNQFLKQNQVFCGNCRGSKYIFGTVNAGALVVDFTNGKANYLNKETGLQNNTVLAADFDYTGNLWLCLDNGIDYALNNSPMEDLIGRNSSIGAGYASLVTGGKILYGTNQGLFVTGFPYEITPIPSAMHRELQGQVWSITQCGDMAFIASDAGVYTYLNGRLSHVDGIHGTYKALLLPWDAQHALASTYEGFRLLEFVGGKWVDAGMIEGCGDLEGDFIFDGDGSIWMSHWRKGIYHLSLDETARTMKAVKLYDSSCGLPTNDNNTVAVFDGKVAFSTRDGFFTPSGNSVEWYTELNDAMPNKRHGAVQTLADGSLAYIDDRGVYLASKSADGTIRCTTVASGNMRELLIPGYTKLNYVSPDEIIISTQNGFNTINTHRTDDSSWTPVPFVSSIYANQDSIVYTSRMVPTSGLKLELPFELNSLKFEFAYPEFDEAGMMEYSSYLENYDADWIPFTNESTREYTRLNEGDYVMHLRVRDRASGEIREAALGFTISPPWFRTTMAKTLYILSLILVIGLIAAGARTWVDRAKRQTELRKEKELNELRKQAEQEALVKDYEIANLKTEQLENDIRHKSQELSSTAMSLIRKNEILNDIASQLDVLQKLASADNFSRTQIQKNITKLQTSIEKNLSEDNDRDVFNKNFDIVYDGYSKRLSEAHPNLTSSDKRLCCYIRMGLSSKEIAPLINISYKSVEMARYRLRKKLCLDSETSLTDYLGGL